MLMELTITDALKIAKDKTQLILAQLSFSFLSLLTLNLLKLRPFKQYFLTSVNTDNIPFKLEFEL